MGITFTNNWKNISDKLRSTLRTEFKGALPVFINDEPISTGGQFVQLDLTGTELIQKLAECEIREYSVTMNYVYQNPNIKKSSLDHVLRYVSRIEQLMQNNISLSLADSTDAVNCRVESTTFEEGEDSYLVSFDYKCQHVSGLSEVISTTPTFNNIKSVNFDGSNDYLEVANNSSLVPTSAMTVSAWIKVDWDNSPAFPRIVDKNFTSYRLAIDKLSVEKSLFFFINGQFAKSTANALNTDNWQHVVGVFDKSLHSAGNSIRLYINGSEASYITQQSTGGNITSTSDNLHIGSDITDDAYFAGNIDEVAIWDTALDAEAVAAIYNSGVPTNLLIASGNYDEYTDNLQGYWRMGDGDTFPTIIDNSSNTNNATMTNMDSGDIVEDTP